jgi:hypothetical protein
MKRFFFHGAMLLVAFVCFATTAWAQANPANPYDEAGAVHNMVLSQFFNEYSKERAADEGLNDKGLDAYICAKLSVQDCSVSAALRNANITQATKGMSLSATAAYLQAKGLVGDTYVAYMERLEQAVGQHVANYPSLYRTVVALESSILGDAALKEDERKQLLTGSSVARYSAKFWTDAAKGTTGYAGLDQAAVAALGGDGILEDVILQDAWGAFIGGCLGFAGIGTSGGGGFLGPAIRFAIGASIGRAIFLLWGL